MTKWVGVDPSSQTAYSCYIEFALLVAGYRFGLNKSKLIKSENIEFVKEFAFDANRKRMSVVYRSKVSSHLLFPSSRTILNFSRLAIHPSSHRIVT